MLHYIKNKSIISFVILPLTILLGTAGYLFYKSKHEICLIKKEKINLENEQIEDDDLYKNSEDLFIWWNKYVLDYQLKPM